MKRERSTPTPKAEFFLQALAALDWQRDGEAFSPDEIRYIREGGEDWRRRYRASRLGLNHLESAYRELYRYSDRESSLHMILEKAKELEDEWRKKNEGSFVLYERGGGYRISRRRR